MFQQMTSTTKTTLWRYEDVWTHVIKNDENPKKIQGFVRSWYQKPWQSSGHVTPLSTQVRKTMQNQRKYNDCSTISINNYEIISTENLETTKNILEMSLVIIL